jgi:hypothetical protein
MKSSSSTSTLELYLSLFFYLGTLPITGFLIYAQFTHPAAISSSSMNAPDQASLDSQARQDAVIVDADAALALAVGLPLDKDPLIQSGPQGYAELVLDLAKYHDLKLGWDNIGTLLTADRAQELIKNNDLRPPREQLRIVKLPSKDNLRYVITSDDLEQAFGR